MPTYDSDGGVALVRFTEALATAGSLDQLKRAFLSDFGTLLGVSMYGFDLRDSRTLSLEVTVAAGVSDVFIARYERDAMLEDPLRKHARDTLRVVYNRELMGDEEWLESPVYRGAYHVHDIRHVIETPLIASDRSVLGNLHFADTDPGRTFTSRELQLTEALGRVLGHAIDGIRLKERAEFERDQALAALDVTEVAMVISNAVAGEYRVNASAERLLHEVVDGEESLHQVSARPASSGGFSRRVKVELTSGATAVLHGHTTPLGYGGGLVTVLELAREQPGIPPVVLTALTPRETEVAVLVAEGLADREIAERLSLSHHTVSQYVKRIYRKLNVRSRVALTRLLLRAPRDISVD